MKSKNVFWAYIFNGPRSCLLQMTTSDSRISGMLLKDILSLQIRYPCNPRKQIM